MGATRLCSDRPVRQTRQARRDDALLRESQANGRSVGLDRLGQQLPERHLQAFFLLRGGQTQLRSRNLNTTVKIIIQRASSHPRTLSNAHHRSIPIHTLTTLLSNHTLKLTRTSLKRITITNQLPTNMHTPPSTITHLRHLINRGHRKMNHTPPNPHRDNIADVEMHTGDESPQAGGGDVTLKEHVPAGALFRLIEHLLHIGVSVGSIDLGVSTHKTAQEPTTLRGGEFRHETKLTVRGQLRRLKPLRPSDGIPSPRVGGHAPQHGHITLINHHGGHVLHHCAHCLFTAFTCCALTTAIGLSQTVRLAPWRSGSRTSTGPSPGHHKSTRILIPAFVATSCTVSNTARSCTLTRAGGVPI